MQTCIASSWCAQLTARSASTRGHFENATSLEEEYCSLPPPSGLLQHYLGGHMDILNLPIRDAGDRCCKRPRGRALTLAGFFAGHDLV